MAFSSLFFLYFNVLCSWIKLLYELFFSAANSKSLNILTLFENSFLIELSSVFIITEPSLSSKELKDILLLLIIFELLISFFLLLFSIILFKVSSLFSLFEFKLLKSGIIDGIVFGSL